MTSSRPVRRPAGGLPVRAHAIQNRERLITVARAAFAAGEGVSLERIAREAGVGIGTLYRHFPTREALVVAVYSEELDAVTSSPAGLLEKSSAAAALVTWTRRYADLVFAKREIRDVLMVAATTEAGGVPSARERVTAVIDDILTAGRVDGTLRDDVDTSDVVALLLGAVLASAAISSPEPLHRRFVLICEAVTIHRASSATSAP
jgi:AcrR family transcriptional regulator